MSKQTLSKNDSFDNIHLPRWNEIPEIDLYLDQVVTLLENYLNNYIKSDNEKDGKIVTKTMINNYVKHHVLKPPINKKYNREHIAYLFVIFILKQIYSINDIKKLIDLAINTSSPEQAYNRFCIELENAIKLTFNEESYTGRETLSHEKYILRNVVQSFANKLYVVRTFLEGNDNTSSN